MNTKYTLYCLFNTSTKCFIGFSMDSRITDGNVLYKKIEFEAPPNLANLGWDGDIETGKLVQLSDKNAMVSESDLERKMYDRFFRTWSGERTIFTILFQLESLRHNNMLGELQPEFKEMMEFFVRVVSRHIEEIDFFKESENHQFIDKAKEKKIATDRFSV